MIYKIKPYNLKPFDCAQGRPVTRNLRGGFGLLETILATTILILMISSAVFLANFALKRSQKNVVRYGAYQIAQAQLELLRQVRDTNFQQGRAWDSSFESEDTSYVSDDSSGIWRFRTCTSNSNLIALNATNYRFYVNISKLSAVPPGSDSDSLNNYKKATVYVTWQPGVTDHCVSDSWDTSQRIQVETFITNWKRL